jgi:hypothetical protein
VIAHLKSQPAGPTAVSTGPLRDVPRLRDEFDHHHCVRLPELLNDAVLERVLHLTDEGEFSPRAHAGISTELLMRRGKAPALLVFLINDPELFEFVRAITGCDRIGAFHGRLYRMMPGPEHEDSWHDDLHDGRMVAMSINLTPAKYDGGALEIRDRHSKEVLHRAVPKRAGDALLFRISPRLEHRVTVVRGAVPRTAYAGWFMEGPDSALLHPHGAGTSEFHRDPSHG